MAIGQYPRGEVLTLLNFSVLRAFLVASILQYRETEREESSLLDGHAARITARDRGTTQCKSKKIYHLLHPAHLAATSANVTSGLPFGCFCLHSPNRLGAKPW